MRLSPGARASDAPIKAGQATLSRVSSAYPNSQGPPLDECADPWVVMSLDECGTPLALVTLAFDAQPRLYPYFVRGNACDTSW